MAWSGWVRYGLVRWGTQKGLWWGAMRCGEAWQGTAGGVGRGLVKSGGAQSGEAPARVRARFGVARLVGQGTVWRGMAGYSRAWSGWVWLGTREGFWFGPAWLG